MADELSNKVNIQEVKLEYMSKSLDELINGVKKTNEQIQKIAESLTKQEVILTKISAMEEKYSQDYTSVQDSITSTEVKIGRLEKDIRNRPCISHGVVEKEIEWIKAEISKHNKIFWTVTSVIITTIITIGIEVLFSHKWPFHLGGWLG